MSASQPYHKSERMFRRYENVIQEVVEAYPGEKVFDPAPYTQQTYACRLRDSMSALLVNKWPTSVDVKKLAEIRKDIEVCMPADGSGMVVVCKRGMRLAGVTPLSGGATEEHTLDIVSPTIPHLHAICLLLSEKKISGPVRLLKVKLETVRPVVERWQLGLYEDDGAVIIV